MRTHFAWGLPSWGESQGSPLIMGAVSNSYQIWWPPAVRSRSQNVKVITLKVICLTPHCTHGRVKFTCIWLVPKFGFM